MQCLFTDPGNIYIHYGFFHFVRIGSGSLRINIGGKLVVFLPLLYRSISFATPFEVLVSVHYDIIF